MKYKATLAAVALILLVAGIIWYQKQNAGKNPAASPTASSTNPAAVDAENIDENSQEADAAIEDFNALCESGGWMKIADLSGELATFSGVLHWVDVESDPASQPFEDYTHYLEGKEKLALIGQKTEEQFDRLDLFQGREVEVQGIPKQGLVKELEVAQIRCSGRETDKSAIENRAKMLDYIAGSINSIAPEKAKFQKWSPDSASVIDEKNIYVDYYDTIQDDENSDEDLDTMHRVLLEMTPRGDGNFYAKVLAYYVPGEDDYVLKSGSDRFKNLDETALAFYSYDSEENSWTRE